MRAHGAARQCLALVSLYIAREDFDVSYDWMPEAKLLDSRISVVPGIESIRLACRPYFSTTCENAHNPIRTDVTFSAYIAYVTIFYGALFFSNSTL